MKKHVLSVLNDKKKSLKLKKKENELLEREKRIKRKYGVK